MPFADDLIGIDVIRTLATEMAAAAGEGLPSLESITVEQVSPLALRARTELIAAALLRDLPADYREFAAIFRRALAVPGALQGWAVWPLSEAVSRRVLEGSVPDADFRDALALHAELTPGLTSEWGIRALLLHDLDLALEVIGSWTRSPDEHVRRLASEGTRAYLPWGIRVPRILAEPEAMLPILDALYRDDSEYVRRSVANHLNDISRHRPELVLETCARWQAAADRHTPKLISHALRTLVKNGDPGALALLGFAPVHLDVSALTLSAADIELGAAIGFTASVHNPGGEPARVVVDYVVHHRRSNGGTTAKTFKLKTLTLAPGASILIDREHSFRPISTRRYYPGEHSIALQVNGVGYPAARFRLGDSAA